MKTYTKCIMFPMGTDEARVMQTALDYKKQITEELNNVPEEKLSDLARIVHVFAEPSEEVEPFEKAFKRGWADVKAGRVNPIETLWDGIDAD